MRKSTICLALLLCSLAAYAQKQPQWRVIESVVLRDQTAPIPLTTLLTPQTDGVYRLSGYMEATPIEEGERKSLTFSINWTDVSGTVVVNAMQVDHGNQFSSINSIVFGVRPGTPVVYQTDASGIAGYKYMLIVTVEQLQ